MNWNRKHAKTSLTMWAEPQRGYRFEVVAKDIQAPVKAHATTPEQKRHQIASVPTIEIGILAAERVWEVEFRKQHSAEQMKTINQARAEGPTVRYVLDVTEPQAMVAQQCIEFLYGTVTNMRMLHDDDPEGPGTALLQPASLWEAVQLVNEDLTTRGEWPPMRDILMQGAPGGREAHDLTLFLQNNYRWERDGTLVEAIWPDQGATWVELAAQHPGLFDKSRRATA